MRTNRIVFSDPFATILSLAGPMNRPGRRDPSGKICRAGHFFERFCDRATPATAAKSDAKSCSRKSIPPDVPQLRSPTAQCSTVWGRLRSYCPTYQSSNNSTTISSSSIDAPNDTRLQSAARAEQLRFWCRAWPASIVGSAATATATATTATAIVPATAAASTKQRYGDHDVFIAWTNREFRNGTVSVVTERRRPGPERLSSPWLDTKQFNAHQYERCPWLGLGDKLCISSRDRRDVGCRRGFGDWRFDHGKSNKRLHGGRLSGSRRSRAIRAISGCCGKSQCVQYFDCVWGVQRHFRDRTNPRTDSSKPAGKPWPDNATRDAWITQP